ncbi:hypothetical protein FA10DRAFT_268422 [Acaromyces ingoldii]|uniref:Mitotic-spindle organizing protein 1 n=1 Tax=Acaromyces ingoldii TaxID=215250 RepID=A0A316YGB6_9BASI|nr:hypothetical protein FA10DRAFT_268422 [Acaromyces ingoldii]PWN88212.1 hypothetical protein FA10DRAFT_268422 [Acaromyces ingoldii]
MDQSSSTAAGQQRASERSSAEQQSMDLLFDLAQLLNTGLSREQLRICTDLIQAGENPEAVATIVKELRKEATKQR